MDNDTPKTIIRQAKIQLEKRQQALNDKRSKLNMLKKEITAIEKSIEKLTLLCECEEELKDVF